MTKVHGHISRLGVAGSLAQIAVLGTIVESGYTNPLNPSYVYYDDGITYIRKGVRDGYFVIDIRLTDDWEGIEDVDWKNLRSLKPEVATAPVLVSATVEDAAPADVILTYDKALDEASTPATTDFILAGKTISLVVVSGTTVTVTVSVAYEYGDTITISYTAGDNPIQESISGIDALSFSDQAVTNNIAETYPAVLDDGDTTFFYDPEELSTITKDGSNYVSRHNDFRGSGHDLLQATGTNQSLWLTPGTILYDGIDNFLQALFTWTQPGFIYAVVRQKTWTINDVIFGTGGTGVYVIQSATTPGIKANAGTSSSQNDNLVVNTWSIVRIYFNGASSKLQINETVATTGNFGAAALSGFTVGARSNGSLFSNIETGVIIGRKSAVGETDIYDYLVERIPT